MQIQLKQSEIIAAIKQYVVTQGINLNGKTVDIAFSATRGAAGIIADVSIEEVSIPGFTDSEVDAAIEAAAPVAKLTVVQPTVTKAAVEEPQTSGDEPQTEAAAEPAPTKATSLFN